MRAIYILWLRQIKRFIRKKASVVGALGQPVIFLLAFGFGLSHVFAKAGEGSYIQFVAPGIIAMTVLFTSMFIGIEIIWDKQFGFLKETFVAPVSRWEIFIGKTLGGATVAIIQGVLIFLFYLSGALFPLVGLPKVLEIITKINPLSYGVDGMRSALNGVHVFSPWLSFAVLVGFSVVTVAAGVYQFRKIEL